MTSSKQLLTAEPRQRRAGDFGTLSDAQVLLREEQKNHPFWQSRLLRACREGALSKEDFRFIFAQYYQYSKNFTRYLAAVMANCENDLFRAWLSENLWEEGGGEDPEKRHAEIFRRFLRDGLSVDVENIEVLDATRTFVHEYLAYCTHAHTAGGAALLSYGTEGIVREMYEQFVMGMTAAGIDDKYLVFFHLHIACDDGHAETLEEMTVSYLTDPDLFRTCLHGVRHALDLRLRFFDNLMDALPHSRMNASFQGIQDAKSLTPKAGVANYVHRAGKPGEALYSNRDEARKIQLDVDRIAFGADVLDPRIARIPAGASNERHRHAHETVMYFTQGKARVHIDEHAIEVAAGDLAFVPRWANHQVENIGADEIVYLAVTDFGLASRIYVGDYLKGHRAKHDAALEAKTEK